MSAQVRRRLARFFNSGNGKHGVSSSVRAPACVWIGDWDKPDQAPSFGLTIRSKDRHPCFTFAPDFVVFPDSANLFYKCDELVMR